MAMYKYNGVRLRGVPSWDVSVYANAIIYYVANESGVEEAHFGYSDRPFYLDTTLNLVTNTEDATIYASIYDATAKEWGEVYLFYDAAFALEPSKVLWSNVDVLDDTGAVFLTGSEPVKLFPRDPWTKDFFVGLCSRPLPMGAREPVAWLYNGVRLPGLPEWDEEAYPHRALQEGGNGSYFMYCMQRKGETIKTITDLHPSNCGKYIRYYYSKDSEWEIRSSGTDEGDGSATAPLSYFVWANYDIFNSDGTLYLAASDPIPVYE